MGSGLVTRFFADYRSPCLALLAVAWPCVAAAQAGPPAVPSPACSASGARFAIGQAYTPDLAARAGQAAGARAVRKIERGGAYTMDFSPNRLNIEVDGAGIVRDLTCG